MTPLRHKLELPKIREGSEYTSTALWQLTSYLIPNISHARMPAEELALHLGITMGAYNSLLIETYGEGGYLSTEEDIYCLSRLIGRYCQHNNTYTSIIPDLRRFNIQLKDNLVSSGMTTEAEIERMNFLTEKIVKGEEEPSVDGFPTILELIQKLLPVHLGKQFPFEAQPEGI